MIVDGGTHTIVVRALDYVGNVDEDSVTIVVDVMPPSVLIESPFNDSIFNVSSFVVSWSATDDCGVDHYSILIYNSTWDGGWVELHNTSMLVDVDCDGYYGVRVRAYDVFGRYDEDEIVVLIDTRPPVIYDIDYPEEVYVGMEFTVLVNTSDLDVGSGIAGVYLYYSYDNDTWECVEMEYSEGLYRGSIVMSDDIVWIRVVVVDNAGNICRSDVITIEASVAGISRAIWAVLLATVCFIVGILAYIVVKRRKSQAFEFEEIEE